MKNNNDISIYVVTHKDIKFSKRKGYKIIHVGAAIDDKEILNAINDNTGENISTKNKNFCELTALYWIWKNDIDSKIVGITHYRRFFYKNVICYKKDKIISDSRVKKILKRYDMIIPIPIILNGDTVKEHYNKYHKIKDLELCKEIISKKFPEYIESFNAIMNKKLLYSCNMLICRKELYNKYMEWLFEILFEIEKNIDISQYDEYNKRVYGFLAERLFNVWLEKNKDLKLKRLLVLNLEEDFNNKDYFKAKIKRFIMERTNEKTTKKNN